MALRTIALILCASLAALAQYRGETGSLRVKHGIEKLERLGSVLMIAAHPDDENTALLSYFAQGRKLDTAYLSLTRGEGGQNLIGSEQGELMGLIRTQELLAARRIDGARQFFTRAIDFGFSKTADETLAKWGRDRILADTVWAIRKFQPDVIVMRFSGTPRDGHGHHQSSAILGKEAFTAAADPKRFPEQLKHVSPWQAKRAFWNVFAFSRQMQEEAAKMPGKITLDVGTFDPELGLSFGEIAGISRSLHRSQGMGAGERKGALPEFLVLVAGEPAQSDPFDGIETGWRARVPGGEAIANALESARKAFRAEAPETALPELLAARARMLDLAPRHAWAARKLAAIDEVIADAAGLWADASTSRQIAVTGGKLPIQLTAIIRSRTAATLDSVDLAGFASDIKQQPARPLEFNRPTLVALEATLPDRPNQPYWLVETPGETTYRVSDPLRIGEPEPGNEPVARFRFGIGGQTIELARLIRNRYVDPVRGELTRPVIVAPPVSVGFSERSLVFPSAASRTVEVQVRANQAKAAGSARVSAPAGWRVEPESRDFSIEDAGAMATVLFTVTPPPTDARGELRAVAVVEGTQVRHSLRTIDYEHIPPQTVFPEARAAIVRTDARLLSKRVGYVMGAGDDVPAALRQLGAEVTLLAPADLARADLTGFDAIVTGVRAYNVHKDLRANQSRLLDFVERGGTMIVQYNVAPSGFMGGDPKILEKIGPYPMQVSSDRVTVEDSPLQPTRPDHFLLQAPNRITAADYEGWTQERGLYFARTWDSRYTSLWEASDPGEKASQGGTLFARHGKGVYIFTPMSWFRQLPAGVPGAYRIFANFLSAGKIAAR